MTPPRTTGADGLPLHRWGDLPAELATVTMLRERRLRLASDQQHVAWYMRVGNHGRGDHPLYRIADAVPLPPLRGKAAAAYTAARTCARCGVTGTYRLTPTSHGTHGQRLLDYDCLQAELASVSRARWVRERHAAVAWAAGVLADDRVVLVDERIAAGNQVGHIHAATLDGTVLADGTVEHGDMPTYSRTELAGRRLIAWDNWWVYRLADGDAHGRRLTQWLMRPDPHGGLYHQQHPPADPRDVVQTMREQLALMARDEHPDGPPGTCPTLPETGLVPCGEPLTDSGVCVEHRRPLLLAALAGGGHA